jgi:quercetin dioxygenase-like cupin family protein
MHVLTMLLAMVALVGLSDRAVVVLDNARVRAYRTTEGALDGVDRGAGVVIWLKDGRAMWLDDVSHRATATQTDAGEIVIVQLREPAARQPSPPRSGSKPGDAPFVGMSFAPLFENERVSVIRARMDVGAREGVHTHASDTIVVHLSGGEIEDTADGKTVVNRWKSGDVEFEAKGSSHSARNVGKPIDVVLIALK